MGTMEIRDRRALVGFDPDHFRKREELGRGADRAGVFREAFLSNLWAGDSRSGPGSSGDQTATVAAALPPLCERLDVRDFLDVPCGDFSWMASADLRGASYVGADLVPEIVAACRQRYARSDRTFLELDLTASELPAADLMLCRDGLVHLSNDEILSALRNVARSQIRWLLTTTFPDEEQNIDISTGDWRPIDLTKPPFDLPRPAELINEGCTEQDGAFSDKSLGLWPVSALADHLDRQDVHRSHQLRPEPTAPR
jgi:hypothetical protein